jgi:hypothetical protein
LHASNNSHPGGTCYADHNNKASSARWIRCRARTIGVCPRPKRGQAANNRHLAMVCRQRWRGDLCPWQIVRGARRGLAAQSRAGLHHGDDEQAAGADHGRRSARDLAAQGTRNRRMVEDRADRRYQPVGEDRGLCRQGLGGTGQVVPAGRPLDRAAPASLSAQHAVSFHQGHGAGPRSARRRPVGPSSTMSRTR